MSGNVRDCHVLSDDGVCWGYVIITFKENEPCNKTDFLSNTELGSMLYYEKNLKRNIHQKWYLKNGYRNPTGFRQWVVHDEMNFSRFPDMVKRIEQGIYVTTTDDIGMLGRVCSRMPMFHDWFLPSLTKWLWIFDDHTEDCLQESLNETSKFKQ